AGVACDRLGPRSRRGARRARHRRPPGRGPRRGRRVSRARRPRQRLDKPAGSRVELRPLDTLRRPRERRRRAAERPLAFRARHPRATGRLRPSALALVVARAGGGASLTPAAPAKGDTRLGPTPAGARIDFDLVLRVRRAALDRYLAAVADP